MYVEFRYSVLSSTGMGYANLNLSFLSRSTEIYVSIVSREYAHRIN
jgi:hypothetical protein